MKFCISAQVKIPLGAKKAKFGGERLGRQGGVLSPPPVKVLSFRAFQD